MRACMVAYTFYESDGRVRRYAETLAKRGDQVDVIALRRTDQKKHEIISGVNIYRIQKRVINEKIQLSYFLKIMQFLINSAIFLTKQHLKKPYDLIHVHSVPDFEVFAALIPKITGAKIILDIHDIVPEFYANKFNASKNSIAFKALALVEKASIAFSNHVIIANHVWEKTLTNRSVRNGKCSTILNYPDTSIFNMQQPKMRNDNKFIIIYPGTLNRHQGVDIAIKAFALIKDEIPEAEFHIYGEGNSKETLLNLVNELNLGGRVLFKKVLPLNEIAKAMASADLGIVPKRNDSFGSEAFSTKIFEFMALGVPVIVSDTKIDRYYFDESLVMFFKAGDEEDLARCMLHMIKDKELRDSLAKNSLEFIKKYSWDVKKDEYFSLVENLVKNCH